MKTLKLLIITTALLVVSFTAINAQWVQAGETIFGDVVPSEIQYLKKNLKNLNVKGSKVTTLPAEIALLTNLETLGLSRTIKREEKEKIKKMMHKNCVIN